MRGRAFIAAIGLAGTVLAAPGVAAADPAPCTWVVSKVAVPDGYEPTFTRVKGTDSHGGYAGTSLRMSANTDDLIIWTGGVPRVVHELRHLLWLSMAGQNSSGTVLVSGRIVAEERWAVASYSPSGVVTEYAAPEGYRLSAATAINERGDVLASGERISDGQEVGIVWSTIAVAPQIVDTSAGTPQDLDDDGTVLLRGREGKPGALWRSGKVTLLADEGKPAYVQAIRGGKAIGYQVDGTWPESQALLWDRDGAVRHIEDGGTAFAINANGLITGERSTMVGRVSVWRDTAFLGELPHIADIPYVSELVVVGDDNNLFGDAGYYGPLRWTCA
ncbi:hypothetical protein [Lentzea flaviverrucosa]|uniref:Extracellular repeat, HAF family n=1 Tax=Lentzea flaviverrucosa TaxID=200379 RepID=A0A1H9JKS0_9PSEU|nr:hypothetical protein [Lentzea flaviverrucosa]RDI26548.1 hypothetical protein DFR72_107189 [Lentzea flaviverrucosa]SEQ87484.1 hypothetical protein SAMN05216195_103282 [Lentzea flaviverrucosa]